MGGVLAIYTKNQFTALPSWVFLIPLLSVFECFHNGKDMYILRYVDKQMARKLVGRYQNSTFAEVLGEQILD